MRHLLLLLAILFLPSLNVQADTPTWLEIGKCYASGKDADNPFRDKEEELYICIADIQNNWVKTHGVAYVHFWPFSGWKCSGPKSFFHVAVESEFPVETDKTLEEFCGDRVRKGK